MHRHWSTATRYQILLSINNAVITRTTAHAFFQALAAELRRHFDYSRLSINLYDESEQALSYFSAADGIAPAGISSMESRPLSKGAIARMVIQSGQPVIIDDLTRYTDLSSIGSLVKAGLKSTLAFPLVVRNKTLGTIHFSYKEAPPFISELAEILTEVSRQVALAVDNMSAHMKLNALNKNLVRAKKYLMAQSGEYQTDGFHYASPVMGEIMAVIGRVADTGVPVLITGETGTGKDYLARCIHNQSTRREHLFVKINCPALSAPLFESELFGHAKGAFTGADVERAGRFEMADKGTVFLDEIADLPTTLQAKLLEVIQERRFERVGDNRPLSADFRVIAATNRDIRTSIAQGTFRNDLYYRLNTVTIQVPSLRERKEDIPLLMVRITAEQAKRLNCPPPHYPDKTLAWLADYSWPGNVRQLKNLVKQMVILRPGQVIGVREIQKAVGEDMAEPAPAGKRVLTWAEAERQSIVRALKKSNGAVGGRNGAARVLGLPRSTLQYRLRKHKINPRDYQTNP